MLYFIPAWYKQNKWCELEQKWYSRRMHTEFDDTVKQVQLFHRSGKKKYKILILSYTPNFRHFLHRQGVFHAPYWSVFDSIQEITEKKVAVWSFHQLKWPEGIEFVYTPFLVIAYLNGVKYAQIEFGESGNPIEADMYNMGQLVRRNIYDDRGFVSSTEVFERGELYYTDYLTPAGVVKFREYAASGYIEINQKCNTYIVSNSTSQQQRQFKEVYYESISELIQEVFQAHIEFTEQHDEFCIAMHENNVQVFQELMVGRRYILSFYGERYRVRDHEQVKPMVKKAKFLITDSEATSRYLNRDMGEELTRVIDISPYDSRVDFGISQQLTTQNILVPIDDIPQDRFEEIIRQLAKYLTTNDLARVHIFTRNAEFAYPKQLLGSIAEILEDAGFNPLWARDESSTVYEENKIDEDENAETVPVLFVVEQCVDELSVSRCVREQRVLLDMRHNPELYLQINCISTAIPQIVRRQTQYVVEKENGLITRDLTQIPECLDYFLGSLNNWNHAKIFSYELGQQYTTKKLLERWDYVLAIAEKI